MVYNRTITRFIADDNVVYQWMRREIWLASDNSWAWHHLKHVSWRSGWIIFNREWQVHGKSNELTDAFLACPPDWAQGPSLLCDKRGQPLPGCATMYPSCGFCSANCRCFQVSNPCRTIHSTAFVYHTALTDRDF